MGSADVERIDFDALTEKQRDVLSQIAVNNDLGHHDRTLKALERRGLIESYDQQMHDGRFTLTVKRYDMPTWVHIQWCEWCSANVSDES